MPVSALKVHAGHGLSDDWEISTNPVKGSVHACDPIMLHRAPLGPFLRPPAEPAGEPHAGLPPPPGLRPPRLRQARPGGRVRRGPLAHRRRPPFGPPAAPSSGRVDRPRGDGA